MLFLFYYLLVCIVFKTNSQTINYRTGVSEELINLLESAYCSDKADLFPCNMAEGKVCLKSKCVSACSTKNLAPCACQSDTRCNLCCSSARSSCNLFSDTSGSSWVRQNSLESCGPATRPMSNPLCPVDHNGKICDLTAKTSGQVEEPWICFNGQCTKMMCNVFNMPSQVGKTIVNCECRDGSKSYPVCCTDLTNATCIPFQTWLRAPQGRGYRDTIGIKQTTGQPVTSGVTQIIDPPVQQSCSAIDSDGKKCDSNKWCTAGTCQNPCLSSNRECTCLPESDTECHICCFSNEGTCMSSNQNLSRNIFVKISGHECDYNYGRCTEGGNCIPVAEHPLATAFCHHAINEGKVCGDQINFVCRNKSCQHVCNNPNNTCVCNHESEYECRICCKNSSGICDVALSNATVTMVRQPVGLLCDMGLGICNAQGNCEVLPNFCSSSVTHENKKCGSDKICSDQKCLHVCGNPDRQCICAAGSAEECHICCKNQNDNCISSNVNITDQQSRFVRQMGSSCNFTFGTCSNIGECEPIKEHPWTLPFCQKNENDGKACDRREGYYCDNSTCAQACIFPEEPCVCPPSSAHECHSCCRNITSGECRSMIIQSEKTNKPNLRAEWTSCESGHGSCDDKGVCVLLPSFCSDPDNERKKCGSESICMKGLCQHVCGDEEVCVCTSESADPENQCKTCCFNKKAWACEPVSLDNVSIHLIARPYGSVCTIGSIIGSCTYNGSCTVIHNLKEGNQGGRCRAGHLGVRSFYLITFLFISILFN